jgi:ubiquitin-conjugating enzyme E2 D
MSNKRLMKRLKAEIKDLEENPVSNCSASPIDDNMTHWKATIFGPENTPYENGIFKLDIQFQADHPFRPPKITFITPIYHCNINKSGSICLDILKDQWSPALTISKVLLSLCSLLSEPNPDDPLEPEIAKLLKNNKKEHDSLAKEYTLQYANNNDK